jgi:CRP/FNR family transcriptional regulator
MTSFPTLIDVPAVPREAVHARSSAPRAPTHAADAQRIADALALLKGALAPERNLVRAGCPIYRAGDRFGNLYVVNVGFLKIVNRAGDGREQVVGLKFRGDWLGFDGIADGRHTCDAVAMDTGEIWVIRYAALLDSCGRYPALLPLLHEAMSREIAHDRNALMAMCTLPADARVAQFLRYWADALERRGLRSDQITLRMTRAEIGNYLGMTLETVSRALSRLAREKLISFAQKGGRDLRIADAAELGAFVGRCMPPPTLQ